MSILPAVPLSILPSGFALPPVPYLVGQLVAAGLVAGLLYERRPRVTVETVTALAPWMAAGGTLYALYQVDGVPAVVGPLVSSPAVYVTVGILAGFVWSLLAERPEHGWQPTDAPGALALVGSGLLAVALAGAARVAIRDPGPSGLVVAIGILVVALVLSVAVWLGLRRIRDVSATGTLGLLVVSGHALDGVSTAVGYDLLGFGEQTPLSRVVIEVGAALPTADVIGAGWLFVVVKLVLAAVVVALFDDYVREDELEGSLLLGLVAAVGLGPGAHNVVLFAIA